MKVTDEKLKSVKTAKFAFFDIDNTIADGYSASSFMEFCHKLGEIKSEHFQSFQSTIDNYAKRFITYQQASQLGLNLVSLSLKGRSQQEVEALVDDYYQQNPLQLRQWYPIVQEYLQDEGFEVMLVSASPDFLVRRVAKVAKAQQFFSTKIEVVNNVYTGAPTRLLNDHNKAIVVNETVQKLSRVVSLGFGDSLGDVPMLEQVNHAFVVDNDHHAEMIDYARSKGWTIFAKAEEVIAKLSAH